MTIARIDNDAIAETRSDLTIADVPPTSARAGAPSRGPAGP